MEEQEVGRAEPETPVSDGAVETMQTDASVSDAAGKNISYQSHRKMLAQKKKAEERLVELEERAMRLEQEKLEAEGSKDQLIEKLKVQLAEKERKYKSAVGNYAFTSIKSQLEAEAAKLGCVDSDALTKLVDLETLDVDHDTFRADPEQVKMLIDEVKQQRPYLFSKHGPKLDPHVPKTGDLKEGVPDPGKLTKDELIAQIKSLDQRLK